MITASASYQTVGDERWMVVTITESKTKAQHGRTLTSTTTANLFVKTPEELATLKVAVAALEWVP